mmetsp:Transcript_25508/g.57238  ORF Transcript_25508/g.57238 Transcript_25508/m.57238 type:complete len:88 (-) Transcript_25508:527-790(-)
MIMPPGPEDSQPEQPPVGLTLPGAASLVEELDKRLLVVLRDGRNLVGVMRSFDQFSNMVYTPALWMFLLSPASLRICSRGTEACSHF